MFSKINNNTLAAKCELVGLYTVGELFFSVKCCFVMYDVKYLYYVRYMMPIYISIAHFLHSGKILAKYTFQWY